MTRREYKKQWRANHLEACRESARRWYNENPVNREKKAESEKRRYAANRERRQEISRQQHADLKKQIIEAYGGKCACCGVDCFEFLSVDHIDGSGAQHRKQFSSSRGFYLWLRKNEFPKDNFRLLCFNCNCARGLFGYCPHERVLTRGVGGFLA